MVHFSSGLTNYTLSVCVCMQVCACVCPSCEMTKLLFATVTVKNVFILSD